MIDRISKPLITRLQKIRTEQGVTATELARKAEICEKTIYNAETGQHQILLVKQYRILNSLNLLTNLNYKLEDVFDGSGKALLCEEGSSKKNPIEEVRS